MAITTYAELLTAVGNWVDDSTLSARIPEMIALAEAEFNRLLSAPDMEATATVATTAATESVTLSTSVQSLVAVYTTANGGYVELQPMALAEMRKTYWDMTGGVPVVYALVGGNMLLAPIPNAVFTISYVYVSDVPALTASNTTNWLLTAHPDLYLFGVLMQAEFFGWNDARLALVKQRVDEIIGQINKGGNQRRAGSAPIRMRSGIEE